MPANSNASLSDPVKCKETLTEIASGTRAIPLFTVGPDDAHAYPGLIVVHEIFGLNEHIKDVARRFAGQGLRVFAPDLFAQAKGLPADRDDLDAMRQVWSAIPDGQLIDDLKALLSLAQASADVRRDQVGAIGYCMGGAIAFMFACNAPQLAWVADYYGRIFYPETTGTKPKHPIDYAEGLNCPVLGIFSGIDDLIPIPHIDELTTRLTSLGKTVEVKIYDNAPHAFFNDTRPKYHAEAARDAWTLTLDFIARVTRTPV